MKFEHLNGEKLKRKNHLIQEIAYAVVKHDKARLKQLQAELERLELEERNPIIRQFPKDINADSNAA
jgi:hypothetical protein